MVKNSKLQVTLVYSNIIINKNIQQMLLFKKSTLHFRFKIVETIFKTPRGLQLITEFHGYTIRNFRKLQKPHC